MWMPVAGIAQNATPKPVVIPTDQQAAGDAPADPGPLAKLSPALTPKDIEAAMSKVADWQVAMGKSRYSRQWTFAALYRGLLEASATTGNPEYRDSVLNMARKYDWKLIDTRFSHADDEALGWSYLTLYEQQPDAERLADTKRILDQLVARPDDPKKLLWWWCDALFMAPPVLAKMSVITKDRKYLDYMDKEWWEMTAVLYDPAEHLYFRDETFLDKHEKNGKKLFWSRGNGWVLAALAQVLQLMPGDYPSRPKYVAQFKDMAAKVRSLQQPDGLWKTGLLDQDAYNYSEVSGTGFFTYGMAWGINAGILDRKTYLPAVQKAWAGMLQHVYQDGRLGSIQPIGAAPDVFTPSTSYVYGIGAFELAGSELDRMAKGATDRMSG
jgi:rhamnogalacturonyl hydrolase YesR